MFAPELAAFWSAVAATFAALSSFLIWKVQLSNLRESFRPELAPSSWERVVINTDQERLSFDYVENIGKGTALNAYAICSAVADDDRPTYFMSSARTSVIREGEKSDFCDSITIFWNNVPMKHGSKHLSISLRLYYWDSIGMRHQTEILLMAFQRNNTQTRQ